MIEEQKRLMVSLNDSVGRLKFIIREITDAYRITGGSGNIKGSDDWDWDLPSGPVGVVIDLGSKRSSSAKNVIKLFPTSIQDDSGRKT